MTQVALIPAVLHVCQRVLPTLHIQGGASEPFYQAPKGNRPAILFFGGDFVRSLFHELAHYCLAGDMRRQIDDFGYWYSPCGRSSKEQKQFEQVEARPQGLEKLFCEIWAVPFSPSLDDFSGRKASAGFLEKLEHAYIEMKTTPPNTPQRVLEGMRYFISNISTYLYITSRL